MTVIAELRIAASEFPLGRALDTGDTGVHIELERVVPASKQVMPFFWVLGDNIESFEELVRGRPHVERLVPLDRIDGGALYRVEWDEEVEGFIYGIATSGATILEAKGNDSWTFRLRFEDHTGLTELHNFTVEQDITYELVRVATEIEHHNSTYDFGLTDHQREALVLAVQNGYFEVPRAVTLSDLAAKLDITEQSLSERIRRGIGSVLSAALIERSAMDLPTGKVEETTSEEMA